MFLPFRDNNPAQHAPIATYLLVGVNVLVFLGLTFLPPAAQQEAVSRHGFTPARAAQFLHPNREIVVEVPGQAFQTLDGRVLVHMEQRTLSPISRMAFLGSLLTCLFLHGGWLHLIGNMWFLWIFGNNVEDRLGSPLFLAFYLAGGCLATLCQGAVAPMSTTPIIGASGAVAAVLGAYAITWPWARIQTLVFLFVFVTIIEVPALFVLGVWFLGQLLEASQMLRPGNSLSYASSVAWWAHVGGFLAGVLVMPRLSDFARRFGRGTPIDAELVEPDALELPDRNSRFWPR
jgi:membrane associated rhomboid family serine protease